MSMLFEFTISLGILWAYWYWKL